MSRIGAFLPTLSESETPIVMLGVESKGRGVRDGNVTECFRSSPTSTYDSGCVYGCRHKMDSPLRLLHQGLKEYTNMFYKALETFNSRTIQSPRSVEQSRRKLLAAERLLLLYIFLGHINLSDSEVKSRRFVRGLERSFATTEERIESSWPVLRSHQSI